MPPIRTETKKGERIDGRVTVPQDCDHFKRHFEGTGDQVEDRGSGFRDWEAGSELSSVAGAETCLQQVTVTNGRVCPRVRMRMA